MNDNKVIALLFEVHVGLCRISCELRDKFVDYIKCFNTYVYGSFLPPKLKPCLHYEN